MASVKDIGIPGIGEGILMPQLQYQWRLRFTGKNIPFTEKQRQLISMQIISCSLDYHLKTLGMVIEQDRYTSELHDMVKKLSMLSKSDIASDKLSFVVDLMDGNAEVLQSYKFEGCKLIAHKFELDYAASDTAKHCVKFSYKTTKEL